jgi:predicted nucleic acid-binding protein
MVFEDESDDYSERLFEYFADGTAVAPVVWPLEVSNVLLTAVKRDRLSSAEANHYYHLISALPVTVEAAPRSLEGHSEVFHLGAQYVLSSYDASYLALAMDLGLPLATLDDGLRSAAGTAGVPLFGQ